MRPVGEQATAEDYREFGEREAQDSPCFTAWALGVTEDPEVLALLAELPPAKRQPNLVFAAARWHGAAPGPYDGLRRVLLGSWPAVRATVLQRATQTNEAARCATLLPVLAALPGPLALLEVGCSAGLCLYPDRYSYRYQLDDRVVAVDPRSGPSPVVLECRVEGTALLPDVLPDVLPEVVWRAGVDLDPLDVGDPDAMSWLQNLVWPEQQERRGRLAAAVDLARADPAALVRGDLLEILPALVEEVPADATLVVFHSAVAAYLGAEDRARLVALMGTLRGHWVSNEGPQVLGLPLPAPPAPGSSVGLAPFLLALDGEPVAWTHGHGRAMSWCEPR